MAGRAVTAPNQPQRSAYRRRTARWPFPRWTSARRSFRHRSTIPPNSGYFPTGQRVAEALGAGSCATSPITVCGVALGAITIVRDRTRPPVTFLELNVLGHIADLAAAAIERLDSDGYGVPDRRQSPPRAG